MEKDLVDIVMEKSYIELTSAEKMELNEFCGSEAEFNQMKEVFQGVEMMQFVPPSPKAETKESLDSLFDATYPKVAPIWYMSALAVIVPKDKPIQRQPLFQIAAVGLLFLLIFPFMNSDLAVDQAQVAEVAQTEQKEKVAPKEAEPLTNDEVDEDVLVADLNEVPAGNGAVMEPIAPVVIASVATGSAVPVDHPDGVFDGVEIAFSQPASAQPDMLDLLTATF